MKTIVLMGVSCLLLAGVYGVMTGAIPPIDAGDKDKTNNGLITGQADHISSTSKTLDDSHWIDGPLFEKAAGSDLITDNEVDVPQAQSNPETIKQAAPHQETIPEVKQLILELGADSTDKQKLPVESI